MRNTPSFSLAAAALLAGASAAAGAVDTATRTVYGRYGWSAPRHPRHGWSVRQGQRMAKKRRNQQRHRAACRRA